MRFYAILLCVFLLPSLVSADPFRSTAYPLPRFVSLSSDKINVRAGPGEKYPVKWVYHQKHRPVEIVLEYDSWRKIKDMDEDVGWVHSALLSGRRYALTTEEPFTFFYQKPSEKAGLKLKIEPQVLLTLNECQSGWCEAEIADQKGWVQQKSIWGVYEHENFD